MKKKISIVLSVAMLLSLFPVQGQKSLQAKSPTKTYRLKKDEFFVKQGKKAKFSLQLMSGKKKVKFTKKFKKEKLSTKFTISYRSNRNGTISVSKKGVITASAREDARVDNTIGDVTATITFKKKGKKKWKTYRKKFIVGVYVRKGNIATPEPKPTIDIFAIKETPTPTATPIPTATPVPTASPTPWATKKPRPTPTPTPVVTKERIGEDWREESPEWEQKVPGTYSGWNHLLYTWEQLEEMGAIEMDGDRLLKIKEEGILPRTYKFQWKTTTTHFDGTKEVVYEEDEETVGGCMNVIFPSDVRVLGDGKNKVLGGNNYRYDLIIPEGVEEIAPHAFENTEMPKRVLVLPDSCTKIGEEAFLNISCSVIKLSDNVTYIGDWAFCNAQGWIANIPQRLKYLGNHAFCSWTNFKYLKNFNEETSYYNYYKEAGVLDFIQKENNGTVVLPECLEYIGYCAFGGGKFKSIQFPSHIKEIPASFVCDAPYLTDVTIPAGVTKIRLFAFAGCKNLTLHVPSTVTEIGEAAFEDVDVWYQGPAIDKYGEYWRAKTLNGVVVNEQDFIG